MIWNAPPPLETSPEERAERVNLLRPIIDWFWGAFSAVLGSDCSPRANGLFAPGLPKLAGSRLKVETQPDWLTPLAESPYTKRIRNSTGGDPLYQKNSCGAISFANSTELIDENH